MSQGTEGLKVRQHERREVELPVEFLISDRHRGQVRFSAASTAFDDRTIRGTSIDVSPGGMGFRSRQFVPRMCEGTLRVLDPMPVGTRSDGTPIHEVAFAQPVKVRRVRMLDREPTYFIGVSFTEPESVDPLIAERMSVLKRHYDATPSERPGGRRG
jgi:hypothetical protein